MSSLLEQAIVDAKALKEAAMKNAEATIIDKYSDEVKSTLNQLLEQDELEAALGMTSEAPKDEIAEGVPDAFTEDVAELDGVTEGDEAVVTVDFAELAEALKELREGVEEEKEEMNEAFGRPEVVLDKIKTADCDDLKSMNSKHFAGEVKSAHDAAMKKCAGKKEPMDEELELDEESIMEMVAAMLSEEEEEVEEGVMKPRPGQVEGLL
jgi:hypothetical protein